MSQIHLEILGFDRIGFVNDIDKEVSKWGTIKKLQFEADGIKSVGKMKIETNQKPEILLNRLKSINGLVVAKQISE
jgi:hypothetical protein